MYLSKDKACFQHDIAYRDFKDLTRRTASDEILHDKAFSIAKYPKYDGYQCGLASMVYRLFDKETSGGAAMFASKSAIKKENISKNLLKNYTHQLLENSKKGKCTRIL